MSQTGRKDLTDCAAKIDPKIKDPDMFELLFWLAEAYAI
jgi:hypothetical protein